MPIKIIKNPRKREVSMSKQPYRRETTTVTSEDIKKARNCVHIGERLYDISIPC